MTANFGGCGGVRGTGWWWGLGHYEGSSWGLLGGCTQGSECVPVLVVGYLRTDRDWGWGSMQVEDRAVAGQRGHHGHDVVVVVILHGAGRAPPWVRRQVLAWGRRVQVWVRAGAPAHWCWDDGVVIITFIVEGAAGVFCWHWGVSGEGGVLGLLSGPCPLLFPLCTLCTLCTLFSSFSVLVQGGRQPVGRALWLCEVVVEGVHD